MTEKSCAGDEKVKTATVSEGLPERMAFVVETDDAPTIRAKKQSILEQVRATGNGFPHVPHDNRTIWQNSFRTFHKYRGNHVVVYAVTTRCCQGCQRSFEVDLAAGYRMFMLGIFYRFICFKYIYYYFYTRCKE